MNFDVAAVMSNGDGSESCLSGDTNSPLSKIQFERKLNLARRIRCADRPECRTRAHLVRQSKVCVVQHVEEFRAELQTHALARQAECLIYSEIPLLQARGAKRIARGSSGHWDSH